MTRNDDLLSTFDVQRAKFWNGRRITDSDCNLVCPFRPARAVVDCGSVIVWLGLNSATFCVWWLTRFRRLVRYGVRRLRCAVR
jgi:hypothetical protein